MFWPRSCPGRRKTAPRGIAKRRFCCYLRWFWHVASFAAFGPLGAVLGPSWCESGPSGSTFGPQKGPKIVPKVVQNGIQKRNPKSCVARVANQRNSAPMLYCIGGVGGYLREAQQATSPLYLLTPLASTSLPFVLGHLQREKPRTKIWKKLLQRVSLLAFSWVSLGCSLGALLGSFGALWGLLGEEHVFLL